MDRILVIDDDVEIRKLIRQYLERNHYNVLEAGTVKTGIDLIKHNVINLIILDIFLPDGNGIDMCSEIRSFSKIPILLISAKGDDSDVVLGLGIGADDFITKPFSLDQLVARVKAQLRREKFLLELNQKQEGTNDIIIKGSLYIDLKKRDIFCREELVELTAKEFDLIAFLANNEGIVFEKEKLYEKIWGYDAMGDYRTVAVHVKNIREKIEIDYKNPKMVITVWGVGYKFVG